MTVDALIARMTEDARARIAAIRANADADVAALSAASAKVRSRAREETLAARRAKRQRAFDVERVIAQRRAMARVLTAQHAFVDRVFARALSLADVAGSDSRYLAALPRHVAAIAHFLGGRPTVLRCRAEVVAHLRPLLADTPQVEIEADDTLPAGFVAAARDRSCTIDCTLPAQLSAMRPRLEAGLLARVPR